ncbi:MAG TPA: hypothetical protein PK867_17450 [Pirellulales bacterium]|nr:hypothetical protein [Pirellulales bacterium]
MTTREKLERKISKITDAYQALTDKLTEEVGELLDIIETLEDEKAGLEEHIGCLQERIDDLESADEPAGVAA